MSPVVYALLDDLLFTSKLDSAARGLGVKLVCFQSRDELISDIQHRPPDLVVLDLEAEHLGPMQTLKDLARDEPSVPMVGYCSHVDLPTMEAAESLGCGRVLSRSAFVANLSSILTSQPF